MSVNGKMVRALLALTYNGVADGGPRLVAQGFDVLTTSVDEWVVVRDRPIGGDDPRIALGDDGLTVLTGAASILYHPAASLAGNFTIEIELELFDPEGRNEGFGVFFGGRHLESEERSYTYFLIRQDGAALLKLRKGTRTPVLRDWSVSPAVRSWPGRDEGADVVLNRLMIEGLQESVRFLANGEELWRIPRAETSSDGVVGLRVNHGVRIRVTSFYTKTASNGSN